MRMSNKKHHEEKESELEEVNEIKAEAVATPENADQLAMSCNLNRSWLTWNDVSLGKLPLG